MSSRPLRSRQNRKTRGRQPSLASLKAKAWKLLSQTIRGEAAAVSNDYGRVECYTCGRSAYPQDLQAGHAIGGRSGAVLFDEEIIRPQCVRCNIMLRGNYGEFVLRLIREKAEEYRPQADPVEPVCSAVEWWSEKLLSAKQIKKWTRSDLEAKITEYRERLARL